MSDISNDAYLARLSVVEAMGFVQAPSVLYRPAIIQDGTKWCCLYGDNLQDGIAGFGDTPAEACAAFDKAWWSEKTPLAIRLARQA